MIDVIKNIGHFSFRLPDELSGLDGKNRAVMLDDVVSILEQYQRKQLKTDWIPCEERLPSEDEEVIISTKTERVYIGVYTTRYGENKREGFICEDGFMWMNVANAWQPLPAPYKKEGTENE